MSRHTNWSPTGRLPPGCPASPDAAAAADSSSVSVGSGKTPASCGVPPASGSPTQDASSSSQASSVGHAPTSDPTTPADVTTADVIDRGQQLLAVISRRAAAARAEAEWAELQLLVCEAKAGQIAGLELWLNQHTAEGEQLPGNPPALPASDSQVTHPRPSSVIPDMPDASESENLVELPLVVGSPGGPWEFWLMHARQRNAERAQKLQSGEQAEAKQADPASPPREPKTQPSADLLAVPSGPSHPTARRAPLAATGQGQVTPARPAKPSGAATPVSPKTQPAKPAAATASAKVAGAAKPAAAPGAGSREKPGSESRRSLPGWAGVLASLLAHLLLLVALAIITLKMPSPPTGLALNASAMPTPPTPLAITQPPEPQPVAAVEPAVPMPAADLAAHLATVPSSSAPLANLSERASSLPNGVMAATAGPAAPLAAGASFFGAAASGNCFCYVIDASGSMRDGPWEAAKLELLKSLASLQEKQRFYVIFFNRELHALPLPGGSEPAPRALYATPENLQHARRWVDTLKLAGGGPPLQALALAIEKEPDAIYLLTDGVTTADVCEFLRAENRIEDLLAGVQVRVPIHPIAFYSLAGQQMLRQLAQENRGQFLYVPAPR